MKVTLLYDSMKMGGIERILLTLSEGLSQKTDIDLTLLRGGGEFLPLVSGNVNVVILDCTSQPLSLLSPLSKLARYFKKTKPNVVLSFGRYNNCLAASAKLLRRFPFRLIVSERTSFNNGVDSGSKLHQWYRRARSRYLYGQAESCICVSRGIANELVELGIVPREKARVIYNPVVGRRLREQMKDPVPYPWLENVDVPVILSVSRLIKLKGLDTLIRAFARLRHNMQINARLIIAGEGPEQQNLESLAQELNIREDVYFAGNVLNPYSYMARAAVFASASHSEGFGNVLVEALACGANVVSTDCKSGPREILEDGKYGRLVPVGDVDAFAAALRDTLAAPLPGETLKERAAYFSVEQSVEAYYDAILGAGNP